MASISSIRSATQRHTAHYTQTWHHP